MGERRGKVKVSPLQESPSTFVDKSTLQSESSKNASANSRHCAFCLELCDVPAKLCGGCKKRAYCSKKCQIVDWKTTGTGQRHKYWCGRYEHGEEDVDWEVVPVPNKGLGVIAKRFIPAGFRIIVEPVFRDPHSHPGIKDLEPNGASLEAKFHKNAFEENAHLNRGGSTFLGLRTSRVNHNCRPNAGIAYENTADVQIVYSFRDIQPGQEICICYIRHLDIEVKRESPIPRNSTSYEVQYAIRKQGVHPLEADFYVNQRVLKDSWGITCPDNCFCNDPEARKLMMEAKELHEQMHQASTPDGRLSAGEKLLNIYDLLDICSVQKSVLLSLLSNLGKPETSEIFRFRTQQHMIRALQIFRVTSPFSYTSPYFKEMLKQGGEIPGKKFM